MLLLDVEHCPHSDGQVVVETMAGSGESGSGRLLPCADPRGDPYLRTRFAVPARPGTFLRRARLVDRLDRALTTPLTVVNGAAGAGKTLLVADWAARQEPPVAWLTTEAGDQGPGMFWAYVLQTLRSAGVPLSPEIGCPADAGRADRTLLTRLAAELGARERPVILVLDEFDRVTDPEIADQLEFVLHHAAGGLRLVLVTRTEPLLPLHRHRTAGDLTEIRNAELAFTPEEASVLLGLHGLRLPVPVAEALVERTRGWAAGLRLCALAARENPDPEMYLKRFEVERTAVADFLLAEVLERQPPETQDLLLRVSVLERIRPELADALTERGDAAGILAELHRGNAFVEDLGHTWYRLHPLFGEILRAHLRMRLPGLEPVLHRRAADWLRRSGLLDEALGHGAAAGDWDFTAGALVDDLALGQLFTGLRSDDLTALFSRMGPEARSPAAHLVRAARELSRCELDRGLSHLRHAERDLAEDEDRAEDEPGPAAARLSCLLLEALAARLTGSPGRAELVAGTAERLREQVPAHLLDAHPELTALLLTHLGSTRLWAGRFEEARAALSLVTEGSGDASTALPREDCLGLLALIDYLNGWPGRAERRANAALTLSERYSLPQPSAFGIAHLVLAAVAVDRDELRLARAHLDAVADDRSPLRDPVTEAGRAIATGRLLLARGDTRGALAATEPAVTADVASPWARGHTALVASAAHLARGRPEEAAALLHDVPGHQPVCAVGEARARLAAGTPRAALDVLDAVPAETRTGPAVTVRALLVRAEAAHAVGDTAAVRRLVAQALHEARRERLRRPFAEAGGWLRPVLDTAPLRGLAAGWLTPGPAPHTGTPGPEDRPPVVEDLSGRERDVLRGLDRMMSTEEIAADLYVSVNTVKTHLKSVFRKLAVNRRNDAVRRARELHLL